ncbi:MAG: type II secretion system protein [Bacilli bacterium]|nr:type II secretion system protein [Bacilli bacterium]
MKKGFTLVELLAVIIILGMLVVLLVPNVISILKSNNLRVYKLKEKELLRAAEDYIEYDEEFVAPTNEAPVKYLTIQSLISKNYINKILDNSSGEECPAFVKISKDGDNYNLDPCIICGEYKTDRDFCTSSMYQSL